MFAYKSIHPTGDANFVIAHKRGNLNAGKRAGRLYIMKKSAKTKKGK